VEDGTSLSPHVFQIADNAYRDMMTLMRGGFGGKGVTSPSQTILISGESGAGKVLRFFVTNSIFFQN